MRQWLVDRKIFFTYSLRFSILLFLIKFLEIISVFISTNQGIISLWNGFLGFGIDLLYLYSILLIFLLFSLLFGKKANKTLGLVFQISVTILIFFYILFILYLLTTGTTLDQAVYIHTMAEMRFIILKSINHPYFYLSGIIIFAIVFIYLIMKLLKKLKDNYRIGLSSFILAVISPIILIFGHPRQGYFTNEFQFMLTENIEAYFISSSFDYWVRNRVYKLSNMDFDDLKEFRDDLGQFTFVQDSFPFLHLDNHPDVIGQYFRTDSIKPNFVFIACESLSRVFSGEDAYFGSFTPFLDSLENHSLYWENCLSSTERTFGVLPALIGSLPYARKGFATLEGVGYPRHITLMSLLKKNGYHTAYYHGGPLGFDFLYDFIKYQQPDYIFNEPKKGPISNLPNNKEISWGLYDDVMFKKSIIAMKSQKTKGPRFDLFLTLTTHAPFNIPNREYWEKQFDKRLKKLHLKGEQRKRALSQKYRLAAFMYLDNSLKEFLFDYKNNFDFNHTIFVITGDHRMGTPARNALEKYHVPLIIYSPMLKSSQKFSSVVCHLALPPTINAFMKHNYDYKSPDSIAWVMEGLDTVKTFRNIYAFPTMRNARIIEEYIYKDYYLYKNQLYRIKPGIEITPINNDSIKQILINKLERYNKYNYYACYNNKLFPYDLLPKEEHSELLVNNQWLRTISIKSSNEYVSILHGYHFDMHKTKGFILKIDFDVNNMDSQPDSLPMIVYNIITKDNANNIWKGLRMRTSDGTMAPAGKVTHISITQTIDFDRYNFDEGTYLKLYFWNNKKVSCQINKMKVKLTGFSRK